MKKRALLLSFLSIVTPAAAEWRVAGHDGFSTIYLDASSREQRSDGSVRVRALTDYDPHAPQAASFKLSEKGLSEIEEAVFDCVKNAYRSAGGSWFDGPMGTGAVRSVYGAKDSWSKVPAFYAGLFSQACEGGFSR